MIFDGTQTRLGAAFASKARFTGSLIEGGDWRSPPVTGFY